MYDNVMTAIKINVKPLSVPDKIGRERKNSVRIEDLDKLDLVNSCERNTISNNCRTHCFQAHEIFTRIYQML